MKEKNIFKFVLVIFFIAQIGFAQNELSVLNIQGVVRDDKGGAVEDGDYDFTFRIYNSEDGAEVLWEEPLNLTVTSGVYSANLGETVTFSSKNLGFDVPYYVGVQFKTEEEATPRIRLTAAPYALALQGSDNVFPSSGTVGIGTNSTSDAYNLQVLGNSYFDGTAEITGDVEMSGTVNVGNQILLNRTDINSGNAFDFMTGETRQFRLGQASSDDLYLWNETSILMKIENEGNATFTQTVDADNLTIDGKAPFVWKKYDLGDGYTKDYDTGISTSNYYCVVVGVQRGNGDVHESGTVDLAEAFAYSSGGTWRLRASASASASDNIVYTLFIKSELVSNGSF